MAGGNRKRRASVVERRRRQARARIDAAVPGRGRVKGSFGKDLSKEMNGSFRRRAKVVRRLDDLAPPS
jgi:hypothetical protein